MNMIITTQRTKFGYFMDVLLTALGWLAFVLMFVAGIVAILRGEVRGPDTPFLSPLMLASFSTVAGYFVLMAIFSALLLIWAKYNQYRFTGLDRRKAPPALSKERLRASFSVNDAQISQMQGGHVNVLEHDKDGRIIAIQALDVMRMEVSAAQAAVPQPAARVQPASRARVLRWASASYGFGPDGSILPLRAQAKVADLAPIPLDDHLNPEPPPATAPRTPTLITLLSGVDPFQRERRSVAGYGSARGGWPGAA